MSDAHPAPVRRPLRLELSVAEAELIQLALARVLPDVDRYIRPNGEAADTEALYLRLVQAVTDHYEQSQPERPWEACPVAEDRTGLDEDSSG